MPERWALLIQFDGTVDEYDELGDVLIDAAVTVIGERADVSGQGYGDHPDDCPASATTLVVGCECGTRTADSTGREAAKE